MTDQKNTLLAIVLSALVLIGWQIFVGLPQMQKQKQQQPQQQQQTQQNPQAPPGTTPAPGPTTAGRRPAHPQVPGQPAAVPTLTREQVLAALARASRSRPRCSPARSRSRARASTTSR